jgi:hypothetical protein
VESAHMHAQVISLDTKKLKRFVQIPPHLRMYKGLKLLMKECPNLERMAFTPANICNRKCIL